MPKPGSSKLKNRFMANVKWRVNSGYGIPCCLRGVDSTNQLNSLKCVNFRSHGEKFSKSIELFIIIGNAIHSY